MHSDSNNLLSRSNNNNSSNSSSQARHQNGPATTIIIKDKILISNTLNMAKTIAKASQYIMLRMIGDFLVFYADDDSNEKIRYVLSLPKETTEIEVCSRDPFCIQIYSHFAEALEHFLSDEEILKIAIDPKKLKLISNRSNIEINICPRVESFCVYAYPDINFHFGITSSNLERMLISENDRSFTGTFYFNQEQTKFQTGADNENVLKNDLVGIEVNNERFIDLCTKVVARSNKNSIEGICIVFKVNRKFMDYFSVAPNFLKDRKKKKDKKDRYYGQNQPLHFGEKIFFRIKEAQVNREEGPKIISAEVVMSAVRKKNQNIVEQFFFTSDTEVSFNNSDTVFKGRDDFKLIKNEVSLLDVSSFMHVTTSQNIPLNLNNNNINGPNLSNINRNNQIRSLLDQVKVENDDNNNNSEIRNKTVSDVNNSRSMMSSSYEINRNGMKIVPVMEDDYDENDIKDLNFLGDANSNILSSRGGCNSKNNNFGNHNMNNVIIPNLDLRSKNNLPNSNDANNLNNISNNFPRNNINANNSKNSNINNRNIAPNNKNKNDSIHLPSSNEMNQNNSLINNKNLPSQIHFVVNHSNIKIEDDSSFFSDPNSMKNVAKNLGNRNNVIKEEQKDDEVIAFNPPVKNRNNNVVVGNPFMLTNQNQNANVNPVNNNRFVNNNSINNNVVGGNPFMLTNQNQNANVNPVNNNRNANNNIVNNNVVVGNPFMLTNHNQNANVNPVNNNRNANNNPANNNVVVGNPFMLSNQNANNNQPNPIKKLIDDKNIKDLNKFIKKE